MDGVEGWTDFNVALMGAAAALVGLVIVAASVNIGRIIKSPSVSARLAAGIAGLVLAIVGAAVGLIPGITDLGYGITMLVAAILCALFSAQAARQVYANRHPANRVKLGKSIVAFFAPVAYAVGSVVLIAGIGGETWFAVGAIAAIIAAVLISWIALVEVLR
jgi:hypothetical protein